MAPTSHSSSPLRAGWFSFSQPVLVWPRLRLYPDRLELTGWRWFERYRRPIPFHRILQVDARNDALVVWLMEGTTLRLCVEEAAEWKQAIEAHM